MKEKILELRNQGLSYNQIAKQLGCSKGTVSYHLGEGQKTKTATRKRESRKKTVISKRVENFQYDRRIKDKAEDFQRERYNGRKRGKRSLVFRWKDVIAKFGWETTCYLTGRKIKLREPTTYHFDHIMPVSKGGTNEFTNLGICCKDANMAKNNLSKKELIQLCRDILEYNGYRVVKYGTEANIGFVAPVC